jgi:rubredoxin
LRNLVWVKSVRSESWACSECAWAFNPSGPPQGHSLEEMKRNFERQRDKEFAVHVCAEHPRTKGQTLRDQRPLASSNEPSSRRKSDDQL